MGVSVAEYLGQRTDVDTPVILPAAVGSMCPFRKDIKCSKTRTAKGNPICSVRKADGTLWICCEHRLCGTTKTYSKSNSILPKITKANKDVPLSDYQSNILLNIAQHVFSNTVTKDQIFVKREVPLRVVGDSDYKADYIMSYAGGKSPYAGPDRLVLEMQGGGETTGTEKLTEVVSAWKRAPVKTNAMLRAESKASTLETNAWRRQQEQFIVKGNIALQTWKGYGMAFCMGTLLYDYLDSKIHFNTLPDLQTHNWTLALIGIKEDDSQPVVPGPIPLVVDESRMLFTNYQTFVHALINQGMPTPEAFTGDFIDLNNTPCNIP